MVKKEDMGRGESQKRGPMGGRGAESFLVYRNSCWPGGGVGGELILGTAELGGRKRTKGEGGRQRKGSKTFSLGGAM